MRKKELFKTVLDYFQQTMSDTETELDYGTTFQLLVAVVLSAQCTDKRVNLITPKLFEDYPTAETMALATPKVIFEYIKSVSYPNNKAKHLVGLAQMLVENSTAKFPQRLKSLHCCRELAAKRPTLFRP